MRSPRPPRTLPAGGFTGTDGPGAGGGATRPGAGAGEGAKPPPNILPRINAPTATAIGVARLPPGTALFIASSNAPIAVSSDWNRPSQKVGPAVIRLPPLGEDMTAQSTGLRFPRPYRTFERPAGGAWEVRHGHFELDHSWSDRRVHRQQDRQQDRLGHDDGHCARGYRRDRRRLSGQLSWNRRRDGSEYRQHHHRRDRRRRGAPGLPRSH